MDAVFKELGAGLIIPNGTIVYKVEDAAKAFNFTPEQKQSCLLVLGDPVSDTMTIVNHLGETESQAEYEQLIQFSIKQSNENGCKLTNHNKVSATDGRELDILKFATSQNDVYVIYSCLNNKVFMSSTSCNNQNFKQAQAFANQLMTSLCPVEV